jgi:hypothetical protein
VISRRRHQTQRGSALLIVLVFAAIVAIMLYRELPIAAFEAQRQKEELLVSRGEQYKRAVKLFVRKVGRFPNSMDELENTNRMRFLRHRYTDPLTGKDDWRLVHAGPGGIILDSKVKSATDKKDSNALGQGAVFAGFNNTFSGDATADLENKAAPSAALRQRAGATKNAASMTQDPMAIPGSDSNASEVPTGMVLDPATGQMAPQDAATAANGAPPNGGTPQTGGVGNGIGTVQQQLGTQNPQTPEQAGQQRSAFGNTAAFGANGGSGNQSAGGIGVAGGIAGVASNAPGASIKTINDQTKYKLWEFYYDLQKDQKSGAGSMVTPLNANGPGATNGVNTNGLQNNSGGGFGQGQPPPPSGPAVGLGGGSQQPQQPAPPQDPQQQNPPPQ